MPFSKSLNLGGDFVVQTFSTTDIFTTLTETFSSVVSILTGNPITVVIIACAVGIPVLGAVLALFGRRG